MTMRPLLLRFCLAFEISLALTVACPLTVSAQEPVALSSSSILDSLTGTTESELVTRALAQNPTLAAVRQEIQIARGGVTQARLRKNPSLSVGGLQEIDGQDNKVSVGGALPLELFGRRQRRIDVADRKLEASREIIADQERLLTGEVGMRFGETLAAARNLNFVEQLLQINRDFLSLMQARVREGSTAPLDVDEVRVEVGRIDALRIDYQTKAEIALLRLKQAVGIQPDETLRLKGLLEQPPLQQSTMSVDPNQLPQIALDHRPDLAAQRANEAVAVAELRQHQAEAKPDATVSASYERPNSGFSQRAFDAAGNLSPIRQTFNYAVAGIEIALPAFNRNQGSILADTAAIDAARSRITAAGLAVRSEVAQNQVRYQGAQARVAVYARSVREQATRNLEIVRQVYSLGRNTLLDVITEQRRYIEIETAYTDVLLDAYAARVALEQAAGVGLR
jgi:cobalt-zinc-cadmium efflux system outer membrane protein